MATGSSKRSKQPSNPKAAAGCLKAQDRSIQHPNMIRTVISQVLSRIKGKPYTLNPVIPTGYLVALCLRNAGMLARGLMTCCHKTGPLYRGAGVKIRCARKLRTGRNVRIDRGSYLDALSEHGIILGNNVSVGQSTTIECSSTLSNIGQGLSVGDRSGLGTHGFYGCVGGITIGNDVLIGNFVSMHAENHVFSDSRTPIREQGLTHEGIRIGNNCWIVAKTTILDGASIGDGTVIAAGSVVLRGEYHSNAVYGGIPAKLIRMI